MIYFLTFITTILLCYVLIKSKLAIATPTSRGAHNNDTATSGGIALFLPLVISLLFFIYIDNNSVMFLILLSGITLIGMLDDIFDITQIIRLIIQILLSIAFVTYFISSEPLEVFLISFFIIFIVNTLNFFDGIDLLVPTQTLFILISLLIIISGSEGHIEFASLPILLIINISIVSLIVFCIFNFPPASIFLGSSGAYYLGFLLATLFVILISLDLISIYTCLILYSSPMIDTSLVLFTRFFCKMKYELTKTGRLFYSIQKSFKKIVLEPHSLHNFRIMSRKFNSHIKAGLVILSINVVWCLPLAIMSNIYSDVSHIIFLIAIVPYLLICLFNKTGVEEYKI